MSVKFTTIPSKRLAESITASSSSLRLNNILSWDGVTNLTSSDVGTSLYAVLRNTSNTQIEIMELSGTTIASTEITITRRGLQFDGDLTTEVTANKKTWIRNETIVELGTDAPQLFQYLKEYIDGIAVAGAPNASLIAKGLVESATTAEIDADTAAGATGADLSVRPDQLVASKYGTRLPSAGEKEALAGGSTFGTPSSTNKFITQEYNSSATGLPVTTVYSNAATNRGSSTTQFDISNPVGTTFTYKWDATGTDPVISEATMPVGSLVFINGSNLASGNQGLFVVTASATDSFSVTNTSGVVESNKTLGTGHLITNSVANGTYTKSASLKYAVIEVIAGGGSGGGVGSGSAPGGGGGGGGGYLKKTLSAAQLGATEYFLIGPGGSAAEGKPSVFKVPGTYVSLGGAIGQTSYSGGQGGSASGGDLNITGGGGGNGQGDNFGGGSSPATVNGEGGANALYPGVAAGVSLASVNAVNPGTGGSGTGTGAAGVIIITEYFS